jgi:hypothetical protein
VKITWAKSEGALYCATTRVVCWSKVRNELNHLRPYSPLKEGKTDVYYATGHVPAMPRPFPIGIWRITGFKEHPDPTENHGYLYPVFIRTNAVSKVPEWELDENKLYKRPTGRMIDDYDLGLHFSTSDWTQGCIRIDTEDNIRWLWQVLTAGDTLIVTP